MEAMIAEDPNFIDKQQRVLYEAMRNDCGGCKYGGTLVITNENVIAYLDSSVSFARPARFGRYAATVRLAQSRRSWTSPRQTMPTQRTLTRKSSRLDTKDGVSCVPCEHHHVSCNTLLLVDDH